MDKAKHGSPYRPQTQRKVEQFHLTPQKALSHRKAARNLGKLYKQLSETIDYYNTERPHRAAYQAFPKAQPTGLPLGDFNRVRRDVIDSAGKVSPQRTGEFKKLYVGTKLAGTRSCLCVPTTTSPR
ncbi:integrase core domain-containing protein [Corynebacterium glutamicum]|uniref:integrase core domain-containing protein n=1 Tax=Corynebacterium glutamicum TaxID=1718 RepID=UPI0036F43116